MVWCSSRNVPCIFSESDGLENCRYCEYYVEHKEKQKKYSADRIDKAKKIETAKNKNDYIKWILIIILIALTIVLLCGCEKGAYSSQSQSQMEREHLYWKDIECKIEDSWFNAAVPALCTGWIEVKTEEYGIEETFVLRGYEASEMRDYVRDNETITCEMYSWVLDSTGEVTRRMLNKITE